MLYVTKNGDITRKPENYQAILEYVMDMQLDQRQLAIIENNWRAFYNDPLKYKETVVVDMVKLDIEQGVKWR